MSKRFLVALLFGVILVFAAACGADDDEDAAGSGDEEDSGSADKEVYQVATDNAYAPFEFIDEESGELEGFDVELIKALAEEADIEIEIQQLEFDGIVAGVGSGKFDIGIAGMTITEEREENIDFSQPYYEAGLILAVDEDNDEIESIDDVD